MESERDDPHATLARLDEVATTYIDAPRGEGLYHVALGLGAGIFIASQGLPQPWASLVAVAFILVMPAFIAWWRRTHGWWVSGSTGRPGGALDVAPTARVRFTSRSSSEW